MCILFRIEPESFFQFLKLKDYEQESFCQQQQQKNVLHHTHIRATVCNVNLMCLDEKCKISQAQL